MYPTTGLNVGHTCWPTWPTDPRAIWMWPTCWMFLSKSNVKWHENQTWNNAIDFFRIQNWPTHRFLENGISQHHMLQSSLRYIVSWFFTNDSSLHSLDPRFTCLSDVNKENVIYYNPGHIQIANLVCGWDLLDPPNK